MLDNKLDSYTTKTALEVAYHTSKACIARLMEDTNSSTIKAKRKTIMSKDL